MSNNLNKRCWLIGSGYMAVEYSKVLETFKVDYIVFGRGEKSALDFEKKRGKKVIICGLDNIKFSSYELPEYAIVAVNIEELYSTTKKLIELGIRNILIEKPGALLEEHFRELEILSQKKQIVLKIAYNRRFYQSVIKLRELIEVDDGIKSVHFEFTEWSHKIKDLEISKVVLESWLLANSSHVIDLFFNLCGIPKELNSIVSGSLNWFKQGSIFVGSGITEKNIPFSYNSNWEAPGRWSLEISTRKHRFKLAPMERLSVMKIGELNFKEVIMDYTLDEIYKPGIFTMLSNFFDGNLDDFCCISDQVKYLIFYHTIQQLHYQI